MATSAFRAQTRATGWHSLDYQACPISAHGGVSYAGLCIKTSDDDVGLYSKDHRERSVRISFALPIDAAFAGFWFFGFDCAHAGDWLPFVSHRLNKGAPVQIASVRGAGQPLSRDVYADFVWVRREVERLALQAREAMR